MAKGTFAWDSRPETPIPLHDLHFDVKYMATHSLPAPWRRPAFSPTQCWVGQTGQFGGSGGQRRKRQVCAARGAARGSPQACGSGHGERLHGSGGPAGLDPERLSPRQHPLRLPLRPRPLPPMPPVRLHSPNYSPRLPCEAAKLTPTLPLWLSSTRMNGGCCGRAAHASWSRMWRCCPQAI